MCVIILKDAADRDATCRGPYGGQDPNLLGNQQFNGSLANALADSLGLSSNLSAAPQSQSLPSGLPGSNGGLPFNMNGLPNGGGRHPMDSLSAVSFRPWLLHLHVCVHVPRVDNLDLPGVAVYCPGCL